MTKPVFFPSPAAFRTWLEKHHDNVSEFLLGFYSRRSDRTGITYPEALDEALCFGWIDGVRKSLDATRYTIRFTPRRPKSYWSLVNIRRAKALMAKGRMAPSGIREFAKRNEKLARRYSFERQTVRLDTACQRKLRANRRAWVYFQSRPPGYRRTTTFWVMSAKKKETRLRRLATLIELCERGATIPLLTRP